MGHILGTRTGCAVLYEQKATPTGRPTPRTGEEGEVVPGDLVLGNRGGRYLFVDVTVTNSDAAVASDDRAARGVGKRPLLARARDAHGRFRGRRSPIIPSATARDGRALGSAAGWSGGGVGAAAPGSTPAANEP